MIQADPDWCGGITELVKICTLASAYGGCVIPHGHSIHAAVHVSPPSRRRLPDGRDAVAGTARQAAVPQGADDARGRLDPAADAPGLGFSLTTSKIERTMNRAYLPESESTGCDSARRLGADRALGDRRARPLRLAHTSSLSISICRCWISSSSAQRFSRRSSTCRCDLLDQRLGLQVRLQVELGPHPVAGLLAVLAHHDDRRGVGGLEAEHQVQQDERVRVPAADRAPTTFNTIQTTRMTLWMMMKRQLPIVAATPSAIRWPRSTPRRSPASPDALRFSWSRSRCLLDRTRSDRRDSVQNVHGRHVSAHVIHVLICHRTLLSPTRQLATIRYRLLRDRRHRIAGRPESPTQHHCCIPTGRWQPMLLTLRTCHWTVAC